MKKHDGIAKRARQLMEKHGVEYAAADGALFTNLRIILLVVYIYKLLMNLIYIFGAFYNRNASGYVIKAGVMTAVCISTAVMVAGGVMIFSKKLLYKFAGIIGMFLSLPVQLTAFSGIMRSSDGIRGQFFSMHFVPAVIMAAVLVWMLVIIIRAEHIENKYYKKVLDNLYAEHHEQIVSDGDKNVSDEDWGNFLENYDPSGYKKQF